MSYTTTVHREWLQQWMADKREPHTIEEELRLLGLGAEHIEGHLSEYKKLRHSKRLTTGFIWLAIGAFLGFVSCVLSLTNPFPALYFWILYGLTSVAIALIFVGLYFIFED